MQIPQADLDQAISELTEGYIERQRLAQLSDRELFSEILNDPEFNDDLRVLALMDRLVPGWERE